jgi:hypothetical protein
MIKRAAGLIVVLLLAGAGYYLWRSRGASRATPAATASAVPLASATPAASKAASPGAATPERRPSAVSNTLMPPTVPSRDELTKDVAALEAKVAQALEEGQQNDSPDARARLERLFDALRELEKQLPRDHFEPAAIVEEVGKDPLALAQWVNSHTTLVPYRGTLRGPVGVLMDRMGNSLDRALLLHELLRLSGRQVRLARLQLSGAPLETLLAALQQGPVPSAPGDAVDEATVQDIVKRAGIDPAAVDPQRVALREARQQLGERVKGRARAQAEALLTAVKPHMAAPTADESGARRTALADHWFVQYRDGPVWVGLDAVPGRDTFEPLGEPATTMSASALPGDLHHRVRVRVVAEYWKDGRLQPTPVLDHVFAPSAWLGQTVSLRTLPTNWPEARTLRAASDPQRALIDAALAQRAWTPVLVLGTRPIMKHAFTDDGRLIDPNSADENSMQLGQNIVDLTQRKLGGAGGLLGLLPSGTGDSPRPPPSPGEPRPTPVLTAQWLEYELIAPGIPTEKVRRDVFDLLSPETRAARPVPRPELTDPQKLERALALIHEVELLAVGTQVRPEYVTALRISRLLALRSFITEAMASGNVDATPPPSAQPMPSTLMDLAVARSAWSAAPERMYFDRPNLFAHWRGLRPGEQSRVLAREDLDIVSNHLAVRGADPAAAFQARLEQGVLDTNVEMVLLSKCAGCGIRGNAAHLFGAGPARNEPWLVLAPRARVPDALALRPHVRARVNASAATGAIVALGFAPDATAGDSVAWWTVDPRSGRALGIGPDGYGQSSVDYATLTQNILKQVVPFIFCMTAWVRGAGNGSRDTNDIINLAVCQLGLLIGLGGVGAGVENMTTLATVLEWAGILISGLGSVATAGP